MKTSKWILMSASAAVAIAGFVMLTGCEDKASTDVPELGYTSDNHSDVFNDEIQGNFGITPASWTMTSGYYETNAPTPYGARTPTDLWGDTVQFSASGGIPPYGQWRTTTTDMGTIDPDTGLYTVNSGADLERIGVDIVYISDSIGQTAQADVTLKFKQ